MKIPINLQLSKLAAQGCLWHTVMRGGESSFYAAWIGVFHMNKQPVKAKKLQRQSASKKFDRALKTLERMRQSPASDWQIGDIQTVCAYLGITCTSPTRGTHYKLSSSALDVILTVPAHRPIKVPYIKKFIALIDAHIERTAKGDHDE